MRSLHAAAPDWICCTGDVTHNGRATEGRFFAKLFKPLRARLTVIPGNHDRQNDDVAAVLSRGALAEVTACGGRLRLLCLDSTQPMNATGFAAHGEVELAVVEETVRRAAKREEGQSLLVLVHHHLVHTAPDNILELFAETTRLPFAGCLRHGRTLAQGLVGRVAAVLHGHKHRSAVQHVNGLPIVNAGATTELGKYRVLSVLDNDVVDEKWITF